VPGLRARVQASVVALQSPVVLISSRRSPTPRYVRMPFGDAIFPFNYCLLKDVAPAALKPAVGLVC
jgi:hypothetical protein